MPTIQHYINNREKYIVDVTYQRPEGVWSKADMQCLIDTILRGEPMPLFFMNYKSTEQKFYIVDGQQRLYAIRQFYDNQFTLNGFYSGEESHGRNFNGNKPLTDQQKEAFLNYNLQFHQMEDYDDEKVRMIFSRLQRGKPLKLGERLNALPGNIVMVMREFASHPFLAKSIAINKNRFAVYEDASRILYNEFYGLKDSSTQRLFKFFDDYRNIKSSDQEVQNIKSTLNFLAKCFPPEPGHYDCFEKHAWVISTFQMVRDILSQYVIKDNPTAITQFITQWHAKVYDETWRQSNYKIQKFYDCSRGGWAENLQKFRRDTLYHEFLRKTPLLKLDDRRQISDEEKIEVFNNQNGECQLLGCTIKFKSYHDPEYHHVTMWSKGGETKKEQIKILCPDKCHDAVHELMKEDIDVKLFKD